MDNEQRIQHDTQVFSIAASADERWIAYGGASDEPIIVRDLVSGAVIARLTDLKHQAHSLAFSHDGARIAAANLWGGICVWNVADGRLLQTKPETGNRKTRRLVYADESSTFPAMLSGSVHRSETRTLAPNGKFLAVSDSGVRIVKYKRSTELAHLEPVDYGLAQSIGGAVAWSADSDLLAVSGDGWLGLWKPFEPEPHFVAVALPFQERVDAIGVLGRSGRAVYARDREIVIVRMPSVPMPKQLSEWQAFMLQVPEPKPDGGFKVRRDWKWNVSASGHDGIHTFGSSLTWFNETYPAFAGGWGDEQTFESFLNDGPAYSIPDEIVVEVCQAVRILASATDV